MAKADKTDKKIKKCDKKTGKKCGAIALLLSACCLLHGCAQTGSQPSRSQTMNNDFNRCVVVIASKATVSNDCMVAEGDGIQPNEIFTQTMKNEGSESNSPTASPTNDIKPDIDVSIPVNKANAGTSGAAGGALERVVGSAADWVADKINGGDKDAPAAAAPAATSAAASASSCPNGNCSLGGTCPDGSCSL